MLIYHIFIYTCIGINSYFITDTFANTLTNIFAITSLNHGGHASKGFAIASAGAPQVRPRSAKCS